MKGKFLPNQPMSLFAKVTVDLWTEPFLLQHASYFDHYVNSDGEKVTFFVVARINTCFWNYFLTMKVFVLPPPHITTNNFNKAITVGLLSYPFFAFRSSRVSPSAPRFSPLVHVESGTCTCGASDPGFRIQQQMFSQPQEEIKAPNSKNSKLSS